MTIPVRRLVARCVLTGDDPRGVGFLEGGAFEAVVA